MLVHLQLAHPTSVRQLIGLVPHDSNRLLSGARPLLVDEAEHLAPRLRRFLFRWFVHLTDGWRPPLIAKSFMLGPHFSDDFVTKNDLKLAESGREELLQ